VPPADLVATIVRLLVPIAGVVFFGWSAPAMLVLCFTDTIAGIAVICAGVLASFYPPDAAETLAERINAHAGVFAGGVFLAATMAVPLGVPLLFMLGGSTPGEALDVPSLRAGLLVQAASALWSYAGLYRALQVASRDELRLKRRFALVFLRWVAMIMVAMTGVGMVAGQYAGLVLLAVYAVISFFAEVAPDRFVRTFTAGEALDAPPSGDGGDGARTAARPRRRHRRR
jgi:hypothetical protein